MDYDQQLSLVDLVDDAVGTSPCRAKSGQFSLEESADAVRILEQRSEHELDDCSCGALGKSAELSFGWSGYTQVVAGFFTAHFFRYRDRSWSLVR
jgi:hypothetical protein